MKLSEENREALIALYTEKADETMAEVQVAIDAEKWSMAANRLYYALLHILTALFIKDGHPTATHLGAKMTLGLHYVKTGIITQEQGRLFSRLETLREKADYDCFFKADKDDIDTYY
ncbi:MAG: HEPN domain-containing protein, partial [Bacteroidaceae bacterium]|nr:HEPN domain-containing protein [Bacteroidaceae bacterium]